MRPERIEAVEAERKAFERFAGQAENQVGVHMRGRLPEQPAQIGLGQRVILPTRNALLNLDVETLHADFKLQHAGRKARDRLFEAIGQVVGDDFKVNEQRVAPRRQPIEKELQDANRRIGLQIERSVDELEIARAALVKNLQLAEKDVEIKSPGGPIERA